MIRWTYLFLLILCGILQGGSDGVIHIALSMKPTSLNPLLATWDVDQEVCDLIFDRLFIQDAEGQPIPQMVEKYEIDNVAREIRIELRKNMLWHDGTLVEPEDVVETWKLAQRPEINRISDLSAIREFLLVEKTGPQSLRFRFPRPRATLLNDLCSFFPIPRRHYGKSSKDPLSDPRTFQPIGSGPYRLSSYSPDRIELRRWESYTGDVPGRAPGFVYDVISKARDRFKAMLEGRIHYTTINTLHHYLIRKGSYPEVPMTAYAHQSGTLVGLWFNCDPQKSLLSDRSLRLALSELVPWERISRQVAMFPRYFARSMYPFGSWAYVPRSFPLPDPVKAARILDENGWRRDGQTIRRNAKGENLRLTIYSTERSEIARAIVQKGREIGIDFQAMEVKDQAIWDAAEKGQGDMWITAWGTSSDPDSLASLFSTNGIPTHSNLSRYSHPEVDRLFEEARLATDQLQRKKIYQAIEDKLLADRPFVPLEYQLIFTAGHQRIKGITFNLVGESGNFSPGRRVWLLK